MSGAVRMTLAQTHAAPGWRSRDGSYLAQRAVQVAGAGAMALGGSLLLTPVESGLFFLLLSLLGAQALLDAGSSTVLLSFVARTTRSLHWAADGRLTGSRAACARLAGLMRLAQAWAFASALLAMTVLLPLALGLLGLRTEAAVLEPARHITVATIAALALYQLGAATPLVIEGAGRVADVARMRAIVDALGYLAAGTCLLAGAGLWAPAALWTCRGLGQLAWGRREARALPAATHRRWWRRRQACSMAPMQWRLTLSWTSGFLAQQSLIPICYALLGPAVTGRIGLGLFLTQGVLMLATAPVAARTPELGRLAAQRHWPDFRALARQGLWQSVRTACLGQAIVLTAVLLTPLFALDIAPRLPAAGWLAALALSSVVSTAIQGIAAALRACGEEPFLALSLVGALVLPPALLLGAHWGGATGLCMAHLVLNAGVGLPWALHIRRGFEATRH